MGKTKNENQINIGLKADLPNKIFFALFYFFLKYNIRILVTLNCIFLLKRF
jgi:hypothetical protein